MAPLYRLKTESLNFPLVATRPKVPWEKGAKPIGDTIALVRSNARYRMNVKPPFKGPLDTMDHPKEAKLAVLGTVNKGSYPKLGKKGPCCGEGVVQISRNYPVPVDPSLKMVVNEPRPQLVAPNPKAFQVDLIQGPALALN